MSHELELWRFVRGKLAQGHPVMLMLVAGSSGSSPGRRGYKMAVGADGELSGSIGGGMMEVRLVEQAKKRINKADGSIQIEAIEQIHQRNAEKASGMICSGRQTVIMCILTRGEFETVGAIIEAIEIREPAFLTLSSDRFSLDRKKGAENPAFQFEKFGDAEFVYKERLGKTNDLYIIGGGHCSLALSELLSKMDFNIRILDDRPHLNTIEKNRFADEIIVINDYAAIGDFISEGHNAYVVVMTLGFASDHVVIEKLLDKKFRYLGVLGSKAKMAILLNQLKADGFGAERLAKIHTPIGVPINSHSPEEIAVSIAAEIIAVKNAKHPA